MGKGASGRKTSGVRGLEGGLRLASPGNWKVSVANKLSTSKRNAKERGENIKGSRVR